MKREHILKGDVLFFLCKFLGMKLTVLYPTTLYTSNYNTFNKILPVMSVVMSVKHREMEFLYDSNL